MKGYTIVEFWRDTGCSDFEILSRAEQCVESQRIPPEWWPSGEDIKLLKELT